MRKSEYYLNCEHLNERERQYAHETGPKVECLKKNRFCKKGNFYNPPLGNDYGLADSIGMTCSAFSQKRKGKQTISVDDLESLAGLLGCQWRYLACTKEPDGTFKPCSEHVTEHKEHRAILKEITEIDEQHKNHVSAALELITASGHITYGVDPIRFGNEVKENFEYIFTIDGLGSVRINKYMLETIYQRIQDYAADQITILLQHEYLKTEEIAYRDAVRHLQEQ